MMRQAANGRKVKILVPKSRKRGISTFAQLWNLFRCLEHEIHKSLTVAHQAAATAEIFTIAQIAYSHLDPEKQRRVGGRHEIRTDNHSKYRCMTAMGNFGASGSDTDDLHISEAALMESKSNQDAENLAALINSMAQGEAGFDSSLIVEGTGNGPFGIFAQLCMESDKEGTNSEYEVVFISWLEDPDLYDPNYHGGLEGLAPLSKYEQWLVDDLGATAQQVMWRRTHIATNHPEWVGKEGNPPIFGYHYPAVLAECFSGVAGAIYPSFSTRHKQEVDTTSRGWDKYRAIDWGWQGDHPFVCLKVAHNPTSPPALTVDPVKCPNLCNELIAYCIDAKTGQPQKKNDHGPDALRYLVVTMKLRGHVHVYDEMYVWGAASIGPTGVARQIHEWSGWQLPTGVSEAEIGLYAPLSPGAENFCATVADCRQHSLITQFCQWAIPTIAHERPDPRDNSRGEVWDGISEMQSLMAGDATFSSRPPNKNVELLRSALSKTRRKRDLLLDDKEAEALKSDSYGQTWTPVNSYLGNFYLSD